MVLRSGWSRRPWLKRCGQVLAGLILAVLLLPPLLDRPAPETIPDPRQTVADEQNAVMGIAAAMASAPEAPKDYPSPTDPAAMAYVARCAPVLKAADQALARPAFCYPPQTPSEPETVQAAFKATATLRSYARLKLQHAYRLAADGDLPGALADLRRLRAVADRAAANAGSAIDWLVAHALGSIDLSGYQRLLGPVARHADDPTLRCEAAGWSPRVVALWRREMNELARYEGEPAALRRALAAEYHLVADNLLGLSGTDGTLPRFATWFYLPKQSANLAARHFGQAIERLDRPSWERERYVTRPASASDQLWNPVGKVLVRMSVEICPKYEQSADRHLAKYRLTATAIALKLYVERHERLPKSLAALMTDGLLDAVPTDPFTGRPILYAPRDGLVYSAGPNRRDDRGRRDRPSGEADDEAVPLAFVIDAAAWRKAN